MVLIGLSAALVLAVAMCFCVIPRAIAMLGRRHRMELVIFRGGIAFRVNEFHIQAMMSTKDRDNPEWKVMRGDVIEFIGSFDDSLEYAVEHSET